MNPRASHVSPPESRYIPRHCRLATMPARRPLPTSPRAADPAPSDRAPEPWLVMLEARAPAEGVSLLAAWPWLRRLPGVRRWFFRTGSPRVA